MPGQVWWIIEAHTPAEAFSRASDISEIYEMMQDEIRKESLNVVRK